MKRLVSALLFTLLVGTLTLSGCDTEVSASGRRKGFHIVENQLRTRLQTYFAYHQSYPASLYELETEAPGYEVPDAPGGYFFDYDSQYGIVTIRSDDEDYDLEE